MQASAMPTVGPFITAPGSAAPPVPSTVPAPPQADAFKRLLGQAQNGPAPATAGDSGNREPDTAAGAAGAAGDALAAKRQRSRLSPATAAQRVSADAAAAHTARLAVRDGTGPVAKAPPETTDDGDDASDASDAAGAAGADAVALLAGLNFAQGTPVATASGSFPGQVPTAAGQGEGQGDGAHGTGDGSRKSVHRHALPGVSADGAGPHAAPNAAAASPDKTTPTPAAASVSTTALLASLKTTGASATPATTALQAQSAALQMPATPPPREPAADTVRIGAVEMSAVLPPAPAAAGAVAAAAAPVDAEPLAAAPGSAAFTSELATRLTTFVREGVHHARLELNPAEMGPLSVQIQLDGLTAQVHLAAAHADTRLALEQALPQLAGSLREAGLTLGGGGVFEQPRQPQPQPQPQTQSQSQSQSQSATPAGANPGVAGGEAGRESGAVLARRRGVVDLIA